MPQAQTPAVQVCPVPHAVPQVPQLAESVCRLLQVPEHEVCPVPQAHAPAVQVCPVPQALAHAPQLAASVCRFLQLPEHEV